MDLCPAALLFFSPEKTKGTKRGAEVGTGERLLTLASSYRWTSNLQAPSNLECSLGTDGRGNAMWQGTTSCLLTNPVLSVEMSIAIHQESSRFEAWRWWEPNMVLMRDRPHSSLCLFPSTSHLSSLPDHQRQLAERITMQSFNITSQCIKDGSLGLSIMYETVAGWIMNTEYF